MARFALVIGVTLFEDKRLNTLNAPADDVEAFVRVLRDPDCGGFDEVEDAIDKDYNTTRDKIFKLFNGRSQDDLLLLYYSGHGIRDRDGMLFLATRTSNLDDPLHRGLSSLEIRLKMNQSRALRQVTVLDCCHSGAFLEGAKGDPRVLTKKTFGTHAEGRFVLAASDAEEFAWDGQELRISTAERRLSDYTSWLVKGMQGAAAPDSEQITVAQLHDHVWLCAQNNTRSTTPQFLTVDGRIDNFAIARNPATVWRRIARRLDDPNWEERYSAVAELEQIMTGTEAARVAVGDLLLRHLRHERDYDVIGMIKTALRKLSERFETSQTASPLPSLEDQSYVEETSWQEGAHPLANNTQNSEEPEASANSTEATWNLQEDLEPVRFFWLSLITLVGLLLATCSLR